MRMQKDINLKNAEIGDKIKKSRTLTALQQQVEYQISSAFDIFYNSFKEGGGGATMTEVFKQVD